MRWLILLATVVFPTVLFAAPPPPPSRHLLLTQSTTIDGLDEGQTVRVWTPIPPSDDQQDVVERSRKIPTSDDETHNEPKFGNKIVSFTAKADASKSIAFSLTWDITRRQAAIAAGQNGEEPMHEVTDTLQPSATWTIDDKPTQLLAGMTLSDDPMKLGRQLFDVVKTNMEYRKVKPGQSSGSGRGDADWACDSHFGNCTDFHSLFISLAHSKKLPTVFEIGYAIPKGTGGEITGYHCWTWFYAATKGWVPVDISESKQTGIDQFAWLDDNRVKFSAGRNLDLVPKQAGPPLNWFLNPYAEVTGKSVPSEQVHTKMTFDELK